MKIYKVILGILFLFLVSPFAYSQESSLLQLTMQSNEEIYKVGEEIVLYCKVQNVSDKAVNFYPYNQRRVEVRDMDGNLCVEELLQTMENPEPMVTLKSKELFEYTLKGKISRRTGGISDVYQEGELKNYPKGQYKEVTGIFVNFPWKHYYLKENYGKYKITSYFQDGNDLVDMFNPSPEEHKKHLQDTWQGKLISNTVIIEIVP